MITKDSKNILIADDSLFFRTKLSDILVEAGHKVRFARDGNEVINEITIDAKGIDLLILDLQMPNVDGFGVLKWLEENGYKGKLPVLVITSVYEPMEVLEKLKNLGATGLVTKGFTPEEIIFRVNWLLYPEKVEHSVRPRNRVMVSVPVDFTVGEKSRTGYILNISETGLYLHTKEEILTGSVIKLRFSLPGTNRVLNMRGTIRRTTEEFQKNSLFTGCGVMFDQMTPEDQELIRNFVASELKRLGADR